MLSVIDNHNCEDQRKPDGGGGLSELEILSVGAKGLKFLVISGRLSKLQGSPTQIRPISPTSPALCIGHWLLMWILD